MKNKILFMLLIALTVSCKKQNVYIDKNKVTFAVVDLRQVESNAIALKGIDKLFSKKENEVRQKLMKEQEKVSKDYQELETKKTVLDRASLEKKAKKIEADMQKLRMQEGSYGKMFEAVKYQVSMEFNQMVQEASESIAKDLNVVLVFPKNGLLYTSDDITDISLEVSSEINKKHNKRIDVEKYFDLAEKEINQISKK